MCEFSGRLIAWLDRELPENESAEVEVHLESCAECRERLKAYEEVSGAFDAYCEAVFTAASRRRAVRWASIACGAGAAAAAVIAVLLLLPRGRVAQFPAGANTRVAMPQVGERSGGEAKATLPAAGVAKKLHRRAPAPSARIQNASGESPQRQIREARQIQNINTFATEPPIQIAIPADAMFPPGAVPEGMSFTADLTIAADGSMQRLGLHPRLAGFERRGDQQ